MLTRRLLIALLLAGLPLGFTAAPAEAQRRVRPGQVRPTPVQVRPRVRDHQAVHADSFRFRPRRARRGATVLEGNQRRAVVDGTARGRRSAAELGLGRCAGFFTRRPQHYINLAANVPELRVVVRADAGAALLVVTPDGDVYCDAGTRPRLEGFFPAGTYAVYVGTLRADVQADYRLRLRNRAIGGPSGPPPPPAQDGRCVQLLQSRGHGPSQYPMCQGVPYACAERVLGRGHSPSLLSHCRGAEPTCAQTVLQRGHHPNLLSSCRGVEPTCAQTALQRGYHPNTLSSCQGVEASCAQTVLQRGYHPNTLSSCQGVEPSCAQAVLQRGYHPNTLSSCRGVEPRCATQLIASGRHPNALRSCAY